MMHREKVSFSDKGQIISMDSESIETSVLLSVVGIHLEFDDLYRIRRLILKRSNIIMCLNYKLCYYVLYKCVS